MKEVLKITYKIIKGGVFIVGLGAITLFIVAMLTPSYKIGPYFNNNDN